MRIYEGSPRQNFEEVFRSIGAYLDLRGMNEIMITETPDGFLVQGIVLIASGSTSQTMGMQVKETLTFLDDDISRFMDEATARRGQRDAVLLPAAGRYERALRVIGRYMDQQEPRDVFFFEQGGNFLIRLLMSDHAGSRHVLTEFLEEDVERLAQEGLASRKHHP